MQIVCNVCRAETKPAVDKLIVGDYWKDEAKLLRYHWEISIFQLNWNMQEDSYAKSGKSIHFQTQTKIFFFLNQVRERNCNIQPNCFNKLSTSEFLYGNYFVDIFYWPGWKRACLGQVYCNSNIQPRIRLLNSLCKYCVPSDTGSCEQCTIRLEWFNKYHLISQ